jgi:hypothetical protein
VGILTTLAIILTSRRSPEPDLETQVDGILTRIEGATGLKFTSRPLVSSRSREEVRTFLVAQLTDTVFARELDGSELALKRLGMLGDTVSLRQLFLDVLEEQIAGFYDPAAKTLYVVGDEAPEVKSITLTHELVHSLQDQHISLDSIQHIRGHDDMQLAAQAVIEGQAMLEQMSIMLGQQLGGLVPDFSGMRDIIRAEQARMPRFAGAPLVVQEMLLFPYLEGAEFNKRFKELRPGESVLANMPVSTEQIIHADAFFGARDMPTQLSIPVPGAMRPLYENTLGEFVTRLFLREHLPSEADAIRGAAGWDGDRFLVFRSGSSTGMLWVSVWDSAVDASEFVDLLARHFDLRFASVVRRSVPQGERPGTLTGEELRANGRRFFVGSLEIGGKPAVIYVDVPDGASWSVIDFRGIRGTEMQR